MLLYIFIMTYESVIPEEIEGAIADEPLDELPKLTPAEEALVFQHLPLVDPIARKIIEDRRELDDAIGDGSRALVIAATKYDSSLQNPLATTGSTYFADCIRGGILKGLRTMRGRSENGGVENNKPGVLTGTARSLDAPVSTAEGSQLLGDITASPARHDEYSLASFGEDLQRALETVAERDRAIFMRCVVDDQMDTVIAKEFGLHRFSVGRIRKRVSKHVAEVLAEYRD